jgi:hypothetical protein
VRADQKLVAGGAALGAGVMLGVGMDLIAVGLPLAALGVWAVAGARRAGKITNG